ncbi:MAG: hypothetical protein NTZ14_14030 [Hyphomicrobiales bacterium]|nr:hypothetical protein [Hyphomicrobiales bacterium]
MLARVPLSLLYGVAGLAHLLAPEPFVTITPAFVPWPETIVLLTGLVELLGAIALHLPRLRAAAGPLLAL